MDTDYANISLTAKLTAYMRQASDIPFAKEVARFVHADEALETLLQAQQMRLEEILWYAPVFEVRYKSIASTIRKSGIKQVLELASGLSLRGLAMTQDPEIRYTETDLAGLTNEKHSLVSTLREHYHLEDQGNYDLTVANALDLAQLQAATRTFVSKQPIAIITEGLIQYLSVEELETLARNIQSLLMTYGGLWITPDFSLKEDANNTSEQQKRFRRAVAGATGREFYASAFDSDEQMQAFFRNHGLSLQALNQVDEVSEIVSLGALDEVSLSIWNRIKPKLKLWILRLL
ncbi:MAG: hypothetical protein K0Q50_2426 [Vampirovibrio sp.]|jgi:O-methyltransferase involved in polyketide biosynthesis|nr:hypothetical protein [Vampirovibrio sp.]